MRYILWFWGVPMGLFWGWFYLSYNDINFGLLFFSRAMHELVFEVYGGILGIEPTIIPGLVARACIIDTFLIFGIFAFRRRREIAAWWNTSRARPAMTEAGPVPPAE